MLPDRSLLIGQKSVEKNVKVKKFKYVILSNFQTMWHCLKRFHSVAQLTAKVDDLLIIDSFLGVGLKKQTVISIASTKETI